MYNELDWRNYLGIKDIASLYCGRSCGFAEQVFNFNATFATRDNLRYLGDLDKKILGEVEGRYSNDSMQGLYEYIT